MERKGRLLQGPAQQSISAPLSFLPFRANPHGRKPPPHVTNNPLHDAHSTPVSLLPAAPPWP
eukprot:4016536-Alexandrium_andersonii.AAC.1